ncbi:MAG: nitroreductase family protein [Coriobacteriia bacterium]|nr:nitroreductase family protein [Coriobacteriia bacterium]
MALVQGTSINTDLCIGCGRCRDDCVWQIITVVDKKARLQGGDCARCGHCVAICPQGAVTILGCDDKPEEMRPDWRVDADAVMHQLKARRSVRKFTDEKIPQETLMQLVEAGRRTPTASNKQGVSYVVISENIAEYEAIAVSFFRKALKFARPFLGRYRNLSLDDDFLFRGGTAVIVIKANTEVDGALAASSMEFLAQSLGLGVFYCGFFVRAARYSGKIKKKLGVTKDSRVVATLVLGYPAVEYKRSAPRKVPPVMFD